ncbi:MAG: hypothetical protein ACP6KW_05265 [Candidatus Thorarchaeota archaeon]
MTLEDLWIGFERPVSESTNVYWYHTKLERRATARDTRILPLEASSYSYTGWIRTPLDMYDALRKLIGILDEDTARALEEAIDDFRRESETEFEERMRAMADDSH